MRCLRKNFKTFNQPDSDSNIFLRRPLFKSMYSIIGSPNRSTTASTPPAAGSHHEECSLTTEICWSSNGINVVSSFLVCPISTRSPNGNDVVSSFINWSMPVSPILSEKLPGGGRLL